uniref:Putative secreted protein n=1 Tax=Ixodes ricinus TaxID=34613 RepID=A0A6B0UPW1_IXORI
MICWNVVCCCVVRICCTGLAVAEAAALARVQLVVAGAGTRYSCPVRASRASWKPPGDASGDGELSCPSHRVGAVTTEGETAAGDAVSQGSVAAAGRSANESDAESHVACVGPAVTRQVVVVSAIP